MWWRGYREAAVNGINQTNHSTNQERPCTTTQWIEKELSICRSLHCPDPVKFPVLSQIKPHTPRLVVSFRQWWGRGGSSYGWIDIINSSQWCSVWCLEIWKRFRACFFFFFLCVLCRLSARISDFENILLMVHVGGVHACAAGARYATFFFTNARF